MGRNTARATQFAKMVNKMMISKVLDVEAQDHNNNKWRGLAKSQFTPTRNITKGGYVYLEMTHDDNIRVKMEGWELFLETLSVWLALYFFLDVK